MAKVSAFSRQNKGVWKGLGNYRRMCISAYTVELACRQLLRAQFKSTTGRPCVRAGHRWWCQSKLSFSGLIHASLCSALMNPAIERRRCFLVGLKLLCRPAACEGCAGSVRNKQQALTNGQTWTSHEHVGLDTFAFIRYLFKHQLLTYSSDKLRPTT